MPTKKVIPYNGSRRFIEIDGDAVKVITQTVERVHRTSEFFQTIQNEGSISTPILPEYCKLFKSKRDKSIFMIEQPPRMRILHWVFPGETKTEWKLAFPYVIFFIRVQNNLIDKHSGYVFFSPTPLESEESTLYRVSLSNVDNRGHICDGTMKTGDIGKSTLAIRISNFIKGFWESGFNDHWLDYNFRYYQTHLDTRINTLPNWETATLADKDFPLTFPWIDSGYSVQSILNYIMV